MAADIGAASSEDFCGGPGTVTREEFVIKSYTGAIIKRWKDAELLQHRHIKVCLIVVTDRYLTEHTSSH